MKRILIVGALTAFIWFLGGNACYNYGSSNGGFPSVIGVGQAAIGIGRCRCMITPAQAVAAGAMWRFRGTETWHASGVTVPVRAGEFYLEFKKIPDWTTPLRQPVKIVPNQAVTRTACYDRAVVPPTPPAVPAPSDSKEIKPLDSKEVKLPLDAK
jgi:hypothetical protein